MSHLPEFEQDLAGRGILSSEGDSSRHSNENSAPSIAENHEDQEGQKNSNVGQTDTSKQNPQNTFKRKVFEDDQAGEEILRGSYGSAYCYVCNVM